MYKFDYFFKTNDLLEIKDNFNLFRAVPSKLRYSDSHIQHPDLTVIIPTYKNLSTLFEAIESALNQNNAPNYDILIINNDPGDDTIIINKIKSYISDRIIYFRNEKNIGMFGNWLRGIELAKSDYVVYLHADDMFVENTLEVLWKYHLKIEPTAAIIGREHNLIKGCFVKYKQQKKLFKFIKLKQFYKLNKFSLYKQESENGCAALLNRHVIKEIGGWNPSCYPSSDKLMFVNYQARYPVYRVNIPIRIDRVESNESLNCAKLFPASEYYDRIAIINRYFHRNKILKYFVYLSAISMSIPTLGINPVRKLNYVERLLLKLESFVCNLSHQF